MTFQEAFDRFRSGAITATALESTLVDGIRSGTTDPKACLTQIDTLFMDALLNGPAYEHLRGAVTDAQKVAASAPPEEGGTGTVVMPDFHGPSSHDGGTGTVVMPELQGPPPTETGTGTVVMTQVDPHPPTTSPQTTGPARTSMPEGRPTPGAVIDGKYVLGKLLGEGGMGTVWKALDLRAQATNDRNPYVAIKLLASDLRHNPQFLVGMQREAKKSQLLAHPNIVTVFVFDFDDAAAWIVMECLDGRPLNRVKPDDYSLAERFEILEQAAAGLAHAHAMTPVPIVHYDIKPSNVFLTNKGTVKLLDFGIARGATFDRTLTLADRTTFDPSALGALTPGYASPEMIREEPADVRDDVYSFACLAYEFLAGRHPFGRQLSTEAEAGKLKMPRIRALTRRQNRAFEKALRFKRSERTPSIGEFIRELRPQKGAALRAVLGWTAFLALLGGGGTAAWMTLPPQTVEQVQTAAADTSAKARAILATLLAGELPETAEAVRAMDPSALDALVARAGAGAHLADLWQRELDAVFAPQLGRYDAARARSLITELRALLPTDTPAVETLARAFASRLESAIAEQRQLQNQAIAEGLMVPGDGEHHLGAVAVRLLALDPAYPTAVLAEHFAQAADAARLTGNFARASEILASAEASIGTAPVLVEAQQRIEETTRLVAEVEEALQAGDTVKAREGLDALTASGAEAPLVEPLATGLAQEYASLAKAVMNTDPAAAERFLEQAVALAPQTEVDAQLQSLRSDLLRSQVNALREAVDARLRRDEFGREDIAWASTRISELEQYGAAAGAQREQLTRRVVEAGDALIAADQAPAAYDLALYAETFPVLAGRDGLVALRDRALDASMSVSAGAGEATGEDAAAAGAPTPSAAAQAAVAGGTEAPVSAVAAVLAGDDLLATLTKSRVRRFWRDTCDPFERRDIEMAYAARADQLAAAGEAAQAQAHRDFVTLLRDSADSCP